MKDFFLRIFSTILALWLAIQFVPGVEFEGTFKFLLIAGTILGVINFFIRPVLKKIFLPLTWLTLGFFSLVINMAMVWTVDILFPELIIEGIIPLFFTTLFVWILNIIF